MIKNPKDITDYSAFNKVYIPNDFINSDFSYRFNGDYITIITNYNCYTQYTTTYCDCFSYNYKNNVMSSVQTCNTNSNNYIIPFSSISSDINDSVYLSNRFFQDKSLLLIIFILALVFARFLTKERSHL